MTGQIPTADHSADGNAGPVLPPPPLSRPDVVPHDLLLPSHTPLATFGVGAAVGGLFFVFASNPRQLHWDLGAATIGLMFGTLGYLVGLGALTADRARPHWRRPWRWTVGMAIGGALPVVNAVELIASRPSPLTIALTLAVASFASSVSFAALGLLFGLQATLFRGLVFRFTFVGFWVACLCNTLIGLAAAALDHFRVGIAMIVMVLWALGPLVGLVLALGLNHAHREREGEN